jgi:nitroreductase
MRRISLPALFLYFSCAALAAPALAPIVLPAPQTDGGRPLMQVLRDRGSQRAFAPTPLPPQVLSNLLWAAWGVSRPDSGKRTAPSAMNRQAMDLYVVLPDGVYSYVAVGHQLKPVVTGDLRAQTGTQPFVATAPVNLVYVSGKQGGSPEDQLIYGGAQAGFISENVYLFCASEGLATVVRGSVNRGPLAQALGLSPDQKIILVQTVGYPAKQ